jgi:hypothetical protein
MHLCCKHFAAVILDDESRVLRSFLKLSCKQILQSRIVGGDTIN